MFRAWEPNVDQCTETTFIVYHGHPHRCLFLFAKRHIGSSYLDTLIKNKKKKKSRVDFFSKEDMA